MKVLKMFMKKIVNSDYYNDKKLYIRCRTYKKFMPELNSVLVTAKLLNYRYRLEVTGDREYGAFVWHLYNNNNDLTDYKIAVLSVNEKADRVVAVINGKDCTQTFESMNYAKGSNDFCEPLRKVLEEL
jgi:hypothetical protein